MKNHEERAAFSVPRWLVWAAAIAFVLGGLGSFGILDNNEGLYAEIPREMLASHDWRLWVIPHLNGLPYMEKPPLLYWLIAFSFALFGETEWAARVVPALSALSCVALLLWFGKAIKRPQAARFAALIFVSGAGVMAMSHVLMFDMLLTALLTAALMCAWRYLHEAKPVFLRWSYAFVALALLAKGLVALVLYGLVVGSFLLSCERSLGSLLRACAKWFEPSALLVFVAIAAPWHIAASITEPVFAWFYFVNEHVLRFLGRREPHDYYSGAWWYYLPRMVIYLFPWSFLLFGLIGTRRRQEDSMQRLLSRFLLIAWLVPLAFFSVSSAKANYYLVAVMPFAAFHLAVALEDRAFLSSATRLLPGIVIAVLALVLNVALALRADVAADSLYIFGVTQRQFLLYLIGAQTLLAISAVFCTWRLPKLGVLAYLLLPILNAAGMMAALHAMEPLISTRQLSIYLKREFPNRAVYLYRNFEEQSSLPFYLKHPVPVVDARSNDLFWGNKLRANDILISGDQFLAAQALHPVAIVVMQRQLKDFNATGFAARFKGETRIGTTTVFFN